MLSGKKMILFDMDGTLIDSIGIWNDVDQQLLRSLGIEMEPMEIQSQRDDFLRENNGAENPYIAYCGFLGKRYDSALSAEELFQKRYAIAQEYLIYVIDYKPDAEKVLKKLKEMGFTLLIATTTRKKNLEIYRTQNKNIQAKAPLDVYFSALYAREDVHKIKPDPEIYLRIMEEWNVTPEECLVFEDSLIGVEAAHRGGIETAVIYDPHSDSEREAINSYANYTFANFNEVLTAIEKSKRCILYKKASSSTNRTAKKGDRYGRH